MSPTYLDWQGRVWPSSTVQSYRSEGVFWRRHAENLRTLAAVGFSMDSVALRRDAQDILNVLDGVGAYQSRPVKEIDGDGLGSSPAGE